MGLLCGVRCPLPQSGSFAIAWVNSGAPWRSFIFARVHSGAPRGRRDNSGSLGFTRSARRVRPVH